jgi:oligopeptidase B
VDSVLTPPKTEKRPIEREHHGDVVVDEYEWLRAKDDPAVHRAPARGERLHEGAHRAPLRPAGALFEEIRARTKETDLSVPTREGDWWYFTRTVEGRQYGIHCRVARRGPTTGSRRCCPRRRATSRRMHAYAPLPGEQVLLDDNLEAEGHEYYALGSFDVTGRRRHAALRRRRRRLTSATRIRLRLDRRLGARVRRRHRGHRAGACSNPSGRYLF